MSGSADDVFLAFCQKAQGLSNEEEIEEFMRSGGVSQLVMVCKMNKNSFVVLNALGAIACLVAENISVCNNVLKNEGIDCLIEIIRNASTDMDMDIHISMRMQILESALFTIGAILEIKPTVSATLSKKERFVTLLLRCGGAEGQDTASSAEFPVQVHLNAFWILEKILLYQAKGHFHTSCVPEVLSTSTGGLERLVAICNSAPRSIMEDRKYGGGLLRQCVVSILCASLRIVEKSRQSPLHEVERKSLLSRLAMLGTINALRFAQDTLWADYSFDVIVEEETKNWAPQKGIKVEAMIGPNETWRMGVIVKIGKSQKWCHIYDEREKRLVRKVPMEYIREPLVPGEDPKTIKKEMEEKTNSHDASRPKVVVAELLCEVANAISWLESQEPLWKRSHGRALLLSRLFSRTDALRRSSSALSFSIGSGSKTSTAMSSLDGLRLMERGMVRNEIQLDGQSVLDPDLDVRRVRFCLSNFFEALPGEDSNGILVVTYSGKANVGTGNWALTRGEVFTCKDLLKSWDASSSRLRGTLLVLLLDCCGSGAWAREIRLQKRTDVVVQASCRPGQISMPNRFWYKWARFQHYQGNPPPMPEKPPQPKTTLCDEFKHGACRRGSQCSQAHGEDDLLVVEEIQDYTGEDAENFTECEAYLPWSVEESECIQLFSRDGVRKPGIFILT